MRVDAGPHQYRLDDQTLGLDQAGVSIDVLRTMLRAIDKAGLQPADIMTANVWPDYVDLTVICWAPSGAPLCGQAISVHVEL